MLSVSIRCGSRTLPERKQSDLICGDDIPTAPSQTSVSKLLPGESVVALDVGQKCCNARCSGYGEMRRPQCRTEEEYGECESKKGRQSQSLIISAFRRVTTVLSSVGGAPPQAWIACHPHTRIACDGVRWNRYVNGVKSSECDPGDIMGDTRGKRLVDCLFLQPSSAEHMAVQLWWVSRKVIVVPRRSDSCCSVDGDRAEIDADVGEEGTMAAACSGADEDTFGSSAGSGHGEKKSSCGAVVVFSDWELTNGDLIDTVMPALCRIGCALERLHIPLTRGTRMRVGCLAALATACPNLAVLKLTASCYDQAEWVALGSLTSLEKLDLQRCAGLTDITFLRNLPHLSALSLRGTAVTSTALEEGLSQCRELENIDLRECREANELLCLRQVPKLRALALCSPTVCGSSLDAAAESVSLTRICLKSCQRICNIHFVASQPSLEEMCLSDMKLSEGDLATIGQCKRLVDLFMTWCHLPGDCLTPLLQLRQLRRISLVAAAAVTDAFVVKLAASCPNLTMVDVARNQAVTCVNALGKLPHLTLLDVLETSVTSSGIRCLCHCTKLESLQLSQCKQVNNVSEAVAGLCELKHLMLWGTAVTAEGIDGLRLCPGLQRLDLTACTSLTDVNVLGSLKQLHHLNLSHTPITCQGIEMLRHCVAMQSLLLRGCATLEDVGVVLGSLPKLRHLDLSESGVTGRGLYGLARSPSLERLHLVQCKNVDHLGGLAEMPSLAHIAIGGSVLERYGNKGSSSGRAVGSATHSAESMATTLKLCPRLRTVVCVVSERGSNGGRSTITPALTELVRLLHPIECTQIPLAKHGRQRG